MRLQKLLPSLFLAATLPLGSAAAENDPFDFSLGGNGAEEGTVRFSGLLESRNQMFLDTDNQRDDFLSLRQRATLNAHYNTGSLTLFASGFGELDRAKRMYRSIKHGEIVEAWARLDGENTDLTVGRQRIAWGTADGRSTIDRLNIVDFRDPIGNARTSARRTSWAARVEHTTPLGVLEGVYLPFGRDRQLPEFGSPWEAPDLFSLRLMAMLGGFNLTIDNPDDAEGGVRFSHFGEGFDLSAAMFNGYTDAPVLISQSVTMAHLAPLRRTSYNLSGAMTHGNGTLRGEATYTPDFPIGLGQETDLVQTVVGWDTTFGTNIYLNVQLFRDFYGDIDDQYGATFALTDKFHDERLEAGIRGQVANDSQYSGEVFADYKCNDALTLSGRVMLFDGDAGTALGAFEDNDFAELSARFTF